MMFKALTGELLTRYLANSLEADAEVRALFNIPEDVYYTVSVYPHPGLVSIDHSRKRSVHSPKISKSNQPA